MLREVGWYRRLLQRCRQWFLRAHYLAERRYLSKWWCMLRKIWWWHLLSRYYIYFLRIIPILLQTLEQTILLTLYYQMDYQMIIMYIKYILPTVHHRQNKWHHILSIQYMMYFNFFSVLSRPRPACMSSLYSIPSIV